MEQRPRNVLTFLDANSSPAHRYVWPTLVRLLDAHAPRGTFVFDLGCGSGSTANMLDKLGYKVVGVDPSTVRIAQAHKSYPHLGLHLGSTDEPLAQRWGTFPVVVCIEVIEHLFDPKPFAARMAELIALDGIVLISTPYHGYLKNVAIALSAGFDAHVQVLENTGHIKFFSRRSLTHLLESVGLEVVTVARVGRIPALAKSMIAVARKPLR